MLSFFGLRVLLHGWIDQLFGRLFRSLSPNLTCLPTFRYSLGRPGGSGFQPLWRLSTPVLDHSALEPLWSSFSPDPRCSVPRPLWRSLLLWCPHRASSCFWPPRSSAVLAPARLGCSSAGLDNHACLFARVLGCLSTGLTVCSLSGCALMRPHIHSLIHPLNNSFTSHSY